MTNDPDANGGMIDATPVEREVIRVALGELWAQWCAPAPASTSAQWSAAQAASDERPTVRVPPPDPPTPAKSLANQLRALAAVIEPGGRLSDADLAVATGILLEVSGYLLAQAHIAAIEPTRPGFSLDTFGGQVGE